MQREKRVFYIGMITTDAYGLAVGEKTYAGAAARKMILVARALRSTGARAIVVSLPFVGTSAKRFFYGSVLISDSGVPIVFLATMRSKYLRKIFGPFALAFFFLRFITSDDTVVVYNHAIEYIPALLVLRLKGVKLVQDIEDAPTTDQGGWRGLLNRVCFAIIFRITAPKKMVVADHVAKGLNLEDYVVVRGVASQEAESCSSFDAGKWEALSSGDNLRLHFGGTLIPDTGVDLFCETVEWLAFGNHCLDRRVDFKVTGAGEIDKIRSLQERIHGSENVHVDLLAELSKADYLALLNSCHGSLALKRPGAEMSNTTFPSKVIEITASGLALVSTRLGDVTTIFDDESAFFLSNYASTGLGGVIVAMVSAPERVEQVARVGYDICCHYFSEKKVGEEMKRLL